MSVKGVDRVERLSAHQSIVFGPGEPGKSQGKCLDRQRRPRSLWTAIVRAPKEQRAVINRDWFKLTRASDCAQLMLDCVMYDAQVTDRVTVTREGRTIVKWSVWLDPAGRYRFEVWP